VDPDGETAISNLELGDPITFVDQLVALGQIRIRSLVDAITIIDQVTGTKSGTNIRSIAESIIVADSLGASVQRIPILSEAIAPIDVLTRTGLVNRNIGESIALIDVNTTVGTRNYIKIALESL